MFAESNLLVTVVHRVKDSRHDSANISNVIAVAQPWVDCLRDADMRDNTLIYSTCLIL